MRAGLLVEKHLTAEGAECAEVFPSLSTIASSESGFVHLIFVNGLGPASGR